jgi:hypothetical protein
MRNGFSEVENCLSALLVHIKIGSRQVESTKRSDSSELDTMIRNFSTLQKRQRSKASKLKAATNLIFSSCPKNGQKRTALKKEAPT